MLTYYGNDKDRDNYFYNDYDYDYFCNDMSSPVFNCSRFERRHDYDTFNMSNYMSCENCRHFSADNKCILKEDTHIRSME